MALSRRGGHQQRRDRSERHLHNTSGLFRYLVEEFGFGRMPAVQCQRIADLTCRDHAESPQELVALSRIGANGQQTNHCHRDLLELLRPRMILTAVIELRLPMLSLKRNLSGDQLEVLAPHSLIAPYKVAGSIWEHRRALFDKLFLGIGPGADRHECLVSFWSSLSSGDPRLEPLIQAYIRHGL